MDNIKPAIVDGALVAENKTATDNYMYQYFVADGFALSDHDYTVTALIKSNVPATSTWCSATGATATTAP